MPSHTELQSLPRETEPARAHAHLTRTSQGNACNSDACQPLSCVPKNSSGLWPGHPGDFGVDGGPPWRVPGRGPGHAPSALISRPLHLLALVLPTAHCLEGGLCICGPPAEPVPCAQPGFLLLARHTSYCTSCGPNLLHIFISSRNAVSLLPRRNPGGRGSAPVLAAPALRPRRGCLAASVVLLLTVPVECLRDPT